MSEPTYADEVRAAALAVNIARKRVSRALRAAPGPKPHSLREAYRRLDEASTAVNRARRAVERQEPEPLDPREVAQLMRQDDGRIHQ